MSNKKEETKKEETPAAPVAEAIEEDDDFKEFEPCQWAAVDEDAKDMQQWQMRDNWNDDDIEDDFTKSLRAELDASSSSKK
eukprot:scaffold57597_cov55-Attheya_sp.AAC.2